MTIEQIAAYADEAKAIAARKALATEKVTAADSKLAQDQAADKAARVAAAKASAEHDQAMADLRTRMQVDLAAHAESVWKEFLPKLQAAREAYSAVLREGAALCAAYNVQPDVNGSQHGIGTALLVRVNGSDWKSDPAAQEVYDANSAPRLALESLS